MWNDEPVAMSFTDVPVFSDAYWDMVDTDPAGSFPASDPPSWTLGREE